MQRAVAMVLEAIYEQDFIEGSYGFRPGRSAHQALEALRDGMMRLGGGWVLEVDIESFFDMIDHAHLRTFIDQRVRDGVIRRSIGKWLKAGVMEGSQVSYPKGGTPQGGVISPLPANIYLHEVLDKWFEQEVKARLKGKSFLVRYADDFVIVFEREKDARRVWDVLSKRLARFGLKLHPEKTRLICFESPRKDKTDDDDKRGTFDFLGFKHYWTKSRRGNWVIKQKTAASRYSNGLKRIGEYCRSNRHRPVKEQHRVLCQKLTGHFRYFGITGNSESIGRFSREAAAIWRKWLDRRSQRAKMNWDKFKLLLRRYPLPPAICYRSKLRKAANP
jgi:group II intron reverse transcriptase/maturase